MLSQAYDLYSKGLGEANELLSDLRKSTEFVKFVRVSSIPNYIPYCVVLNNRFCYIKVAHYTKAYTFYNTAPQDGD